MNDLERFYEAINKSRVEVGAVDSPSPDFHPALINTLILNEIDSYAQRMVDNLNRGTKYYLRRALTRSIMDKLSEPEIRERINEGEDPGEIIATLGLIDDIATAFKAELTALIAPRAERAAAFEISYIEGSARLEALKHMEMTMKQWLNLGPEPCAICLSNAARGPVPLNYEYDSAFGTCLWPLAHPYGLCTISFDKSELTAIIDTGKEITLYTGN